MIYFIKNSVVPKGWLVIIIHVYINYNCNGNQVKDL